MSQSIVGQDPCGGRTCEECEIGGCGGRAPIPISLDDLDPDLAMRAHMHSSFVPEKRGRQEQEEYVNHMTQICDTFTHRAETLGQKEILIRELERYKQGYLKHLRAILAADSRTASAMITGPSKFPAQRNQKRLDTAMRRREELETWDKKARRAISRALDDARTGDQIQDEEYGRLKKNINKNVSVLEQIQKYNEPYDPNAFKGSITGVLKRSWDNGYHQAVLQALDYLDEMQAKHLNKAAITPRHSIWKLREAEIIEEPTQQGEELILRHGDIEIIQNHDLDRVQIIFPGVPDPDVRTALKQSGWRWSPSNGAWQRKSTGNAVYSAKAIMDMIKREV